METDLINAVSLVLALLIGSAIMLTSMVRMVVIFITLRKMQCDEDYPAYRVVLVKFCMHSIYALLGAMLMSHMIIPLYVAQFQLLIIVALIFSMRILIQCLTD